MHLQTSDQIRKSSSTRPHEPSSPAGRPRRPRLHSIAAPHPASLFSPRRQRPPRPPLAAERRLASLARTFELPQVGDAARSAKLGKRAAPGARPAVCRARGAPFHAAWRHHASPAGRGRAAGVGGGGRGGGKGGRSGIAERALEARSQGAGFPSPHSPSGDSPTAPPLPSPISPLPLSRFPARATRASRSVRPGARESSGGLGRVSLAVSELLRFAITYWPARRRSRGSAVPFPRAFPRALLSSRVRLGSSLPSRLPRRRPDRPGRHVARRI